MLFRRMTCKVALRGECSTAVPIRLRTEWYRVRFARLSRLRTILGASPEENDIPFDANTFVEDDEYLVLDLVLNWASSTFVIAAFRLTQVGCGWNVIGVLPRYTG